MTKTLLVTTANGMFGGAVVKALAGNDAVQVRAMVRDRSKFTVDAPNVSVVVADMDEPDTLVAAVDSVTDVFISSPMDSHITRREINVIDAVTATGTDARILKVHGAVNHRGDALSQLHLAVIDHLKATGLSWTLVSPNSVMETSLLPLKQLISDGAILGTSGHGKVAMVALDNVAEAAAAAVAEGSCVGEELLLTGPEALDMYEVAGVFSDVLGKPVEYVQMSEEDYTGVLVGAGAFPDAEAVEMNVLCHYRAWGRGDAAAIHDGYTRATGKAPTSIREWVTARRDYFLS